MISDSARRIELGEKSAENGDGETGVTGGGDETHTEEM
jgi:hypothetical protein